MSIAEVNGIQLYYELQGTGDPLVFCHEFAGSGRSWKIQVEFFHSRYHTITYNARGYPPSSVPAEESAYSQEQSIEDLRGLLDHLGIRQTHIVALSMGSNVALNFALRYPQMARSLVLAGIGTGALHPEPFRQRVRELAARVDRDGMAALADYPSGPERVQLRRKHPARWREFHDQFLAQSATGTAMMLRCVLGRRPSIFALEAQLRALDVPILLLVGDEDDPCMEPSLFLKRTLPKAGLCVFPRSGHAINLEESALFNQLVSDFLKAVEDGTWGTREAGLTSGSLISE